MNTPVVADAMDWSLGGAEAWPGQLEAALAPLTRLTHLVSTKQQLGSATDLGSSWDRQQFLAAAWLCCNKYLMKGYDPLPAYFQVRPGAVRAQVLPLLAGSDCRNG